MSEGKRATFTDRRATNSARKSHDGSKSTIFFLCLVGLLRLSGIVRSGGGSPIPRRARRRASFATRKRDFFFRGMCHQNKSPARFDASGAIVNCDCVEAALLEAERRLERNLTIVGA